MPGVYKVITAQDLYAIGGTNKIAWKMTHKRNRGTGEMRPVIADKKILRYGDVVAMVCADTREHAREAAAAVKVDLAPLPASTRARDAVMPDAMQIHENVPNSYEVQPLFKDETPGDTREILANSKYVVEGSFYTQREPHLSIEGDILQAYWDPDGFLTVQGKAQAIGNVRNEIGPGIGLTKDQIRIIMNPSGASFGWSTSSGSFALIAACAAVTGMPCNLSMSYLEHHH
jgi:aldehyde oxidoreductase